MDGGAPSSGHSLSWSSYETSTAAPFAMPSTFPGYKPQVRPPLDGSTHPPCQEEQCGWELPAVGKHVKQVVCELHRCNERPACWLAEGLTRLLPRRA
jgi:hypothetical protein